MKGKVTILENYLDPQRASDLADRILEISDWDARICDKAIAPRIVDHKALMDLGISAEEYAKSYPRSLGDLAIDGTMAYLFYVKGLSQFDPEFFKWMETDFLVWSNSWSGEDNNYIEEPQATMYSSGCFLGQHSDGVGSRKIAFILNLSRNWPPDYGGCLTFLDGGKWTVIEPKFNSLVLMDVREGGSHYVSQVASWVKNKRIAITGWVGKR